MLGVLNRPRTSPRKARVTVRKTPRPLRRSPHHQNEMNGATFEIDPVPRNAKISRISDLGHFACPRSEMACVMCFHAKVTTRTIVLADGTYGTEEVSEQTGGEEVGKIDNLLTEI